MVKFEGSAQNVIYMRDKPIKSGFKMYVLRDSINCFFINILFHIDRGKFPVRHVVNFFSKNLKKNDFLYIDRYFCAVDIFINLKKLDIRATGTIMQNRNIYQINN
jgi:hypothetical protein